jgi:hypothetical protein
MDGAVETLMAKVTGLSGGWGGRFSMLPGVTKTNVDGLCACAGNSVGIRWEKFDGMESSRSDTRMMRVRVPERFKL